MKSKRADGTKKTIATSSSLLDLLFLFYFNETLLEIQEEGRKKKKKVKMLNNQKHIWKHFLTFSWAGADFDKKDLLCVHFNSLFLLKKKKSKIAKWLSIAFKAFFFHCLSLSFLKKINETIFNSFFLLYFCFLKKGKGQFENKNNTKTKS